MTNILLVAPPFIPVSKDAVAGVEQMTYVLGKALVEQGQDVTTIARQDSQVHGKLISGGYPDIPINEKARLEHFHQAMNYTSAVLRKTIREDPPDIIIDKCQGISLQTCIEESGPPVICSLDLASIYFMNERYFRNLKDEIEKRNDQFVAVSNHIAEDYNTNLRLENLNGRMHVIYNGIETDNFPFEENPDNYLLYLGRIIAGKAPHLAIQAAKATNHKIIIVGGNTPGTSDGQYEDREYFEKEIKPLLDENVKWFGRANLEQKVKLMQKAKAVIFPSQHSEAFGLVPLETMACGTPTIAYNHSGARISIIDEKTGFLVNSHEELCRAIEEINKINRRDCANHIRNHFTYQKMGEKYLKLIQKLVA